MVFKLQNSSLKREFIKKVTGSDLLGKVPVLSINSSPFALKNAMVWIISFMVPYFGIFAVLNSSGYSSHYIVTYISNSFFFLLRKIVSYLRIQTISYIISPNSTECGRSTNSSWDEGIYAEQ